METVFNAKKLREEIRILERKLGALEEYHKSCCSVTMSQCHAIVEIGRTQKISLNQLAELLNLENSSMSRTVNNLVNNGLVKRDIAMQDRRYVTISLTEKGMELFKGIEEDMDGYYLKVYESIPYEKRQQVIEGLSILIDAINTNKCEIKKG